LDCGYGYVTLRLILHFGLFTFVPRSTLFWITVYVHPRLDYVYHSVTLPLVWLRITHTRYGYVWVQFARLRTGLHAHTHTAHTPHMHTRFDFTHPLHTRLLRFTHARCLTVGTWLRLLHTLVWIYTHGWIHTRLHTFWLWLHSWLPPRSRLRFVHVTCLYGWLVYLLVTYRTHTVWLHFAPTHTHTRVYVLHIGTHAVTVTVYTVDLDRFTHGLLCGLVLHGLRYWLTRTRLRFPGWFTLVRCYLHLVHYVVTTLLYVVTLIAGLRYVDLVTLVVGYSCWFALRLRLTRLRAFAHTVTTHTAVPHTRYAPVTHGLRLRLRLLGSGYVYASTFYGYVTQFTVTATHTVYTRYGYGWVTHTAFTTFTTLRLILLVYLHAHTRLLPVGYGYTYTFTQHITHAVARLRTHTGLRTFTHVTTHTTFGYARLRGYVATRRLHVVYAVTAFGLRYHTPHTVTLRFTPHTHATPHTVAVSVWVVVPAHVTFHFAFWLRTVAVTTPVARCRSPRWLRILRTHYTAVYGSTQFRTHTVTHTHTVGLGSTTRFTVILHTHTFTLVGFRTHTTTAHHARTVAVPVTAHTHTHTWTRTHLRLVTRFTFTRTLVWFRLPRLRTFTFLLDTLRLHVYRVWFGTVTFELVTVVTHFTAICLHTVTLRLRLRCDYHGYVTFTFTRFGYGLPTLRLTTHTHHTTVHVYVTHARYTFTHVAWLVTPRLDLDYTLFAVYVVTRWLRLILRYVCGYVVRWLRLHTVTLRLRLRCCVYVCARLLRLHGWIVTPHYTAVTTLHPTRARSCTHALVTRTTVYPHGYTRYARWVGFTPTRFTVYLYAHTHARLYAHVARFAIHTHVTAHTVTFGCGWFTVTHTRFALRWLHTRCGYPRLIHTHVGCYVPHRTLRLRFTTLLRYTHGWLRPHITHSTVTLHTVYVYVCYARVPTFTVTVCGYVYTLRVVCYILVTFTLAFTVTFTGLRTLRYGYALHGSHTLRTLHTFTRTLLHAHTRWLDTVAVTLRLRLDTHVQFPVPVYTGLPRLRLRARLRLVTVVRLLPVCYVCICCGCYVTVVPRLRFTHVCWVDLLDLFPLHVYSLHYVDLVTRLPVICYGYVYGRVYTWTVGLHTHTHTFRSGLLLLGSRHARLICSGWFTVYPLLLRLRLHTGYTPVAFTHVHVYRICYVYLDTQFPFWFTAFARTLHALPRTLVTHTAPRMRYVHTTPHAVYVYAPLVTVWIRLPHTRVTVYTFTRLGLRSTRLRFRLVAVGCTHVYVLRLLVLHTTFTFISLQLVCPTPRYTFTRIVTRCIYVGSVWLRLPHTRLHFTFTRLRCCSCCCCLRWFTFPGHTFILRLRVTTLHVHGYTVTHPLHLHILHGCYVTYAFGLLVTHVARLVTVTLDLHTTTVGFIYTRAFHTTRLLVGLVTHCRLIYTVYVTRLIPVYAHARFTFTFAFTDLRLICLHARFTFTVYTHVLHTGCRYVWLRLVVTFTVGYGFWTARYRTFTRCCVATYTHTRTFTVTLALYGLHGLRSTRIPTRLFVVWKVTFTHVDSLRWFTHVPAHCGCYVLLRGCVYGCTTHTAGLHTFYVAGSVDLRCLRCYRLHVYGCYVVVPTVTLHTVVRLDFFTLHATHTRITLVGLPVTFTVVAVTVTVTFGLRCRLRCGLHVAALRYVYWLVVMVYVWLRTTTTRLRTHSTPGWFRARAAVCLLRAHHASCPPAVAPHSWFYRAAPRTCLYHSYAHRCHAPRYHAVWITHGCTLRAHLYHTGSVAVHTTGSRAFCTPLPGSTLVVTDCSRRTHTRTRGLPYARGSRCASHATFYAFTFGSRRSWVLTLDSGYTPVARFHFTHARTHARSCLVHTFWFTRCRGLHTHLQVAAHWFRVLRVRFSSLLGYARFAAYTVLRSHTRSTVTAAVTHGYVPRDSVGWVAARTRFTVAAHGLPLPVAATGWFAATYWLCRAHHCAVSRFAVHRTAYAVAGLYGWFTRCAAHCHAWFLLPSATLPTPYTVARARFTTVGFWLPLRTGCRALGLPFTVTRSPRGYAHCGFTPARFVPRTHTRTPLHAHTRAPAHAPGFYRSRFPRLHTWLRVGFTLRTGYACGLRCCAWLRARFVYAPHTFAVGSWVLPSGGYGSPHTHLPHTYTRTR